MTPCVGSKIVKAKPMTKGKFLVEVKGEKSNLADTENQDGYLVEYPDGYQGWNEKEEFERCSRLLSDNEINFLLSGFEDLKYGAFTRKFDYYVTTKILGLAEAFAGTDPSGDAKETREDGYYVTYPNGHQSWTPKIKADEVYRKINQDEYELILEGHSSQEGVGSAKFD